MKIRVPKNVENIIGTLESHGYEAYAVGGCVRDTMLGREPQDWDITTSARPQEVKALFRRTIDTGIEHGTVTVMIGGEGYEVTTYRIDGKYSDSRHPESVTFTPELREDLRRRDFTINAMAYNDRAGVQDLFCGQEDLDAHVVRAVGEPEERFREDALRIMRCVRFAAQLGFEIDPATYAAAEKLSGTLDNISRERIREELLKILVSDHPDYVTLLQDIGALKTVFPEFEKMQALYLTSLLHEQTAAEHTLRTMALLPKDKVLRLTALFHDAGKPDCCRIDEEGRQIFENHEARSAAIADRILGELKFDNDTRKKVVHLVAHHGLTDLNDRYAMRKAMHAVGKEEMGILLRFMAADDAAKSAYAGTVLPSRAAEQALYEDICASGECTSLSELQVTGGDLIALGMKPGKSLGAALAQLLEEVLRYPSLNDRETLRGLAYEKFVKGIEMPE